PDGQHLVVDYFNETAGSDYNRVYPDLYHKYVGHDNNRDWIFFTQAESRIRTELEQKYRPVILHFMHQAGANNPRMWLPPFDEPLGPNVDSIVISAANALGAEIANRSEEHTSELQSRENLVCRLLLEKKKDQASYRTC